MRLRLAALSTLAVLTGCALLREKFEPVSYYDLSAPGAVAAAPDATGALPSLRVTRLDMLGPYAGRMTYRKTEHRLVHDEYHRWVQPPRDLLTRELYRRLSGSGRFRQVLSPNAAGQENLRLAGTVLKLECTPDLAAELHLVLTLEHADDGRLLFDRHYEDSEAFEEPTSEAFAEAASTALERIVAALIKDIAAATAGGG